ncbi:MAG TPA: serine hydrolase domain-containing protein [Longimicrobium sp.]|jgi:CubicO group peptidase (beta-lactamase class C family)
MNRVFFAAIVALSACAPSPAPTREKPAAAPPRAAAPRPAPRPALVAPADVGMSERLIPSLDSILEAAIADRASPGAAIAVGRSGRVVASKGYGRTDWAQGAPAVTDSTLYDLASLTKVVATTTAAMILEEEGRLDLDRAVAHYLPHFDAADKAAITPRMLLVHNSGMRAYHVLYREAKGRDEYLKAINARPLAHPPGTHTEYIDWNLIVLQLVIERVTGEPLDGFLRRRVFEPLGMRETRFNPPESLRPRIAPTEVQAFRGGQVWGVVHDENAWSLGGVAGHAGLFSSARDLAVFAAMMLNGGEYGGVRILRPETISRWTRRQNPGTSSRALGWDTPYPGSSAGRYFSPTSFGHTGFTGTSIWMDPVNGVFVVLLTNRINPTRDNPKLGPLRTAVADAVQRSVLGNPPRNRDAGRQ